MLRLFIEPVSMEFAALYKTAAEAYNCTPPSERNSGFDLHCDLADVNNKYSSYAALVGQGCRALAVDKDGVPRAFWLSPRSSISKTPLRLANSLGLIDGTYRGILKAAFVGTDDYTITPHERLVQIAAGDLRPWLEVVVVDALPGPTTERGAGGFGSTGRS
jgi:dUTP pyrophosphatase